MPLDEMLVFARVVEHQSFAGAARQLGLTTSAVSRSVGRLEAHFGLRLLQRTTRSLSLTEAGAEIHQACLRLVEDAQAVQALAGQLRQQPRGLLKISAPAVLGDLWLSPLLPGFCARWLEVQVQVDMTDRMVDLVAEGLDLGLRISVPGQIAPGLVARPLKTIRYVLVATPGYLARHAQITGARATAGASLHQPGLRAVPERGGIAPAPPCGRARHAAAGEYAHHHCQQPGHHPRAAAGAGHRRGGRLCRAGGAAGGRQLAPVLPGWALCGKYAPRVVHAGSMRPRAMCR